jgi:hypothetical protein
MAREGVTEPLEETNKLDGKISRERRPDPVPPICAISSPHPLSLSLTHSLTLNTNMNRTQRRMNRLWPSLVGHLVPPGHTVDHEPQYREKKLARKRRKWKRKFESLRVIEHAGDYSNK